MGLRFIGHKSTEYSGTHISTCIKLASYTYEFKGGNVVVEQSINDLSEKLVAFAQVRDWEQFHSPKNLAMALAGEAGELLEHFQWLTEQQSQNLAVDKKQAVAFEMADILIYLLRLSERLDVDVLAAAYQKMAINEQRYPADKVKGDARRADEYA